MNKLKIRKVKYGKKKKALNERSFFLRSASNKSNGTNAINIKKLKVVIGGQLINNNRPDSIESNNFFNI